jgi:hypothetical protein
MREMISILEDHAIRTAQPGYIVYGYSFQIVAEPFSD